MEEPKIEIAITRGSWPCSSRCTNARARRPGGSVARRARATTCSRRRRCGPWTDPSVDVERNPNHTKVEIEGDQGERHIKLIRKETGGDTGVIEMHHEPFDTEREPGMTDEGLEAKIQAQMEARGMDGTVKVEGDEIRIRVEKEEEIEE